MTGPEDTGGMLDPIRAVAHEMAARLRATPTHGNCRFFLAGECRRYPPQVIPQAIMGGPIMSVYPRVKADGGACGEWSANAHG